MCSMDSRDDHGRSRSNDFAVDRDGKPLLDRYGRPVRKRSAGSGSFGDVGNKANRAASAEPQPPRYVRSSSDANSAQPPAAHQRPAQPRPQGIPPRQSQPIPPRPADPSYRPANYPPRGRNGITGPPPRQRNRRPRRKLRVGRVIGAILLVLAIVGVGTVVWADSKLQRVDALQDYEGRVGNTSGTNWLLVGSDSRAGLDAEDADRLMAGELNDSTGRTDTIILVHMPSFGGKARMVSFPRDSLVNIPGHGEDKINAAFTIGGPSLLQQTIEQSTGIHIDHYAEIGFGGFANAVDGVGGIKMCLDGPLKDPMAGIDLAEGCQKLDGPNALGFVRSRYASANGDLDRVVRQRQFLSALSKKLVSPGTILNPFHLFPTVSGVAKALTVDNGDHMWHLARLGLKIRSAQQESVPTAGAVDTWAGNALQWDEQAAEELFSQLR